MTLFNDLWKKFKQEAATEEKSSSVVTTEKKESPVEKPPISKISSPSSPLLPPPQESIDAVVNTFQQTEIESLQSETVHANLQLLQDLLSEPKEEAPELRFTQIKQHLGTAECHETVRQERWQPKIRCPKCQSSKIKRVAQLPGKSPNNHRYRCLNCDTEFNDDTDTPMEKGLPPLNIWMQCWYLMGCTESLSFIAHKLGLDMSIVELMVRELKKLFNANQPLSKLSKETEWHKQALDMRKQLKEDLLKNYERLNANIATQPKDTTEFRRQQNLRRDLSTTPTPPSPRGGHKR